MSSWIADLREAVVTEIATNHTTDLVIGEWVSEIEREQITEREIRVVVISRKVEVVARGLKKRSASIGLLVVEPLQQKDEDRQADAIQELGDSLEGLIAGRIGGFRVSSIEQPLLIDHDEWRNNRHISVPFTINLECEFPL